MKRSYAEPLFFAGDGILFPFNYLKGKI